MYRFDFPLTKRAHYLHNGLYEGLHGRNRGKCLRLFKYVAVLQGPIFHASLLAHIFAYEGLSSTLAEPGALCSRRQGETRRLDERRFAHSAPRTAASALPLWAVFQTSRFGRNVGAVIAISHICGNQRHR